MRSDLEAIQLNIIVPCYNEEEVLPETNRRLLLVLAKLRAAKLINRSSGVVYVDDGSHDGTWRHIEQFAAADTRVHGLKLSRNFGHQNALLAGLLTVEGDALVSIDADLQDNVDIIENMIREYLSGNEVVYGVRGSRIHDTLFKRITAQNYYRLMQKMGVDLVHDHADFRLMGRRALEALREFREVNLFLRGIVPLIGFQTSTVSYNRAERYAGSSKYPLVSMLAFAIEGVTSFSVSPLRIISFLGLLMSFFSLAMIIAIIYSALAHGYPVPGWASSVVPIYFLGGIQLLAMGILGEYIAKIYMETKARPRYQIDKIL